MRNLLSLSLIALLAACGQQSDAPVTQPTSFEPESYYGTLEPFASEAVYFVVTDRFVNGDPDNDFRDQGGANRSFDIPLPECDGVVANIGYLGGDFRGLLNNAGYIRDMGFTAVWITPIVENPDEAFTGGDEITCTSFLTDRGKAAYHGYWGTNFYRVDEHLPSEGLDFADLTRELRAQGLKTVLDIVGNHGSPSWTMPTPQPGFGQVFDAEGNLIADHQNLHPSELDPAGNPLHAFYNGKPDLAQLGDFDPDNPAVMDYLVGAYLQWIEQGAAAFRVDTIRHQPFGFWKTFAERIRERHPGFYLFGEAFDYEADNIAPFTWPENGGISVLDFPLKQALDEVFGSGGADFERLAESLHLKGGPYQNPYDLATFYDNHDMARMNASDEGFIDAHNFLFTARGIPVVYYGSEVGFMRGRPEHAGNRNYFGQARVDAAVGHPIRESLKRVAQLRQSSIALQRGLQLNVRMQGDEAVFYRVFQHDGVRQTALVLLNKGDAPRRVEVSEYVEAGRWRDGFSGEVLVAEHRIEAEVPAHGLRVFLLDAPITRPDTRQRLDTLMARKTSRP
jgi:cyclomaltodextrin glucanotransferase